MSKTRIYQIWFGMIDRCSNPKYKSYHNYGGRGIAVSSPWLKFENFYADMGEKPKDHSLDRIDNNGPYSKSNCRWATQKMQARNRRTNRLIEFNGVIRPVEEWGEMYNFKPHTFWLRLKNHNWNIKAALEAPRRKTYTRRKSPQRIP